MSTNLLIRVKLQGHDRNEHRMYRVPPHAPLVDVIIAAQSQSNLMQPVRCLGLDVIGTLEPHLFGEYPTLVLR